ncbi:hypothetical protein LZ30DRAFT_201315 [Colletotrichum cereale]|nr:hypothetical protein LZ30DRAFT_201315 [Colletotrichum cereale]
MGWGLWMPHRLAGARHQDEDQQHGASVASANANAYASASKHAPSSQLLPAAVVFAAADAAGGLSSTTVPLRGRRHDQARPLHATYYTTTVHVIVLRTCESITPRVRRQADPESGPNACMHRAPRTAHWGRGEEGDPMLLHRAPRCPRRRASFQGSPSLPSTGQLPSHFGCLSLSLSLSLSLCLPVQSSGSRSLSPPCCSSLLSLTPCSLHMYRTERRSLPHPSHPLSPSPLLFLLAPSHLLVHGPKAH